MKEQSYKKYGYFLPEEKEFVITRPDTPAPWVNYITNGRYNGLISHTGGGFSFYRSPKDSRITRWRYNSLPVDRPGRYIYLRDRHSGEYWSPTWQPTATPLDQYECRHGLSYTKISSAYKDIRHSVLYFVPGDDLELWQVTVENKRKKPVSLDIFSYVELALGHALVDLINQPNDQHFNDVFFDPSEEILYASKRYWVRHSGASVEQTNEAWDKFVFIASSLPVIGWDGSRNGFIGRWRSEANPLNVENGKCTNSNITAGDAVGALQMAIDLAPGEKKELVIIMGVAPKENYRSVATAMTGKYRDLNTVVHEYSKLHADWQDYLQTVQVDTPDEQMNNMLNIWNQYQTSVTFRFSRDAS
ncbi:MAG: glycosyl transferase family 36, partial [Calditrichales bacterium]